MRRVTFTIGEKQFQILCYGKFAYFNGLVVVEVIRDSDTTDRSEII